MSTVTEKIPLIMTVIVLMFLFDSSCVPSHLKLNELMISIKSCFTTKVKYQDNMNSAVKQLILSVYYVILII